MNKEQTTENFRVVPCLCVLSQNFQRTSGTGGTRLKVIQLSPMNFGRKYYSATSHFTFFRCRSSPLSDAASALRSSPVAPQVIPRTRPELVRCIKLSVAIETFDSQAKALSRGSGFFIDTDRVVTNRHVIENAFRVEIHSSTGSIFPVKGVLAVDAEGDIALLKVDATAHHVRPLSLERTSPQEGESVVVIGNPFGLEGSVTNGIVSAVRDIPTFGRIIQITAPISPGSSGSPVVNMRGQVIGVASLQITGGQSINFAIPSERISQLQTGPLMSFSELVAATGRNNHAKAVQYFRDGLSFLSKDDCEKALPYFAKAVESDSTC